MVEKQPKGARIPLQRRDIGDARPMGLGDLQTTDCDPTDNCAESCNSCEGSSAASCGVKSNITK